MPESWSAVRVLLHRAAGELGDDRRAGFVVDAFQGRDHAAAVLGVGSLHVGEELVDDEGALRHVDQVRPVAGNLRASAEAAVRKPAWRPITTAQ